MKAKLGGVHVEWLQGLGATINKKHFDVATDCKRGRANSKGED
jgi:hypothetical protein